MLLKVEVLKRSSQEIVLWHFPSGICIKLEGRLKRTVKRNVPLFTEVSHQVRKHWSAYILKELCQGLICVILLHPCFISATKMEQAYKFNDPSDKCSVLVASDAIGMGLNL